MTRDVGHLFKSRRLPDLQSDQGPVELTARHVSIAPTRSGLGFAAVIVLLLLPALIYKNSLLYLLAFTLLSLMLISILHTHKALAGLLVQTGSVSPVFAGDTVLLPVTVRHPGGQHRPALRIASETLLEFALPAHRQKTLLLPMAARRRGRQTVGTLTLSSGYPFGLFTAWSPIQCGRQVLVYPRPAADAEAWPGGGGSSVSDQQNRRVQGGEDFAGVRAYQAGDPIKMIHWKAYAKGQGLFSKQFSNDPEGDELWLDFARSGPGHVEERLSRLCRWVVDAEKAGLRYGLQLPGRQILPARGPGHQALCLEALALFETG